MKNGKKVWRGVSKIGTSHLIDIYQFSKGLPISGGKNTLGKVPSNCTTQSGPGL